MSDETHIIPFITIFPTRSINDIPTDFLIAEVGVFVDKVVFSFLFDWQAEEINSDIEEFVCIGKDGVTGTSHVEVEESEFDTGFGEAIDFFDIVVEKFLVG